jgi:hypothetical protein
LRQVAASGRTDYPRVRLEHRRGARDAGRLSGKPLAIAGLWGLITGDPGGGGLDSVWFAAGPDDESDGLLGNLRAS